MAEPIVLATPCKKCGACDRYADGRCRPCALSCNRRRKIEVRDLNRARRENERGSNPIKACVRCGARERNKRGDCGPCDRARGRARYAGLSAADRKMAHLATNQWMKDHPEKARGWRKAYRDTHPPSRESRRINQHNRNARIKSAGGKLSRDIIATLLRLQRSRCAVCRCNLSRTAYHLDHIQPITKDGRNDDHNTQLLCAHCNLTKHARDPVEFMQSRGFLL